ncbi:MAG TPA: MFS transporter [Rectinemataceae bacterium]|nr:MFS transporter [Rectinemataceae bacterium]
MKIRIQDLPRSIWALFAVRLVVAAGNFIFPFLTLILTTRLGWSSDKAGIFLTAMHAAALPGVFLGGRLSDVLGRKRIIMLCQAVAVVLFFTSLAVGFVPILPFLIAAASVALSMTWPVINALVADLVPEPETRKSAFALLYWGNNIGFSLGPLAAGFLFHRAPGLMFLGNGTALFISIFIMMKFIPDSGSTAAMAGDGREAEASRSGSLWSVLVERPVIIAFALIVAIMNFVYSQNGFSLPLFLNAALGEKGAEIFGSAMTVNGLTVVFCTLLLSRFTAKTPVLVVMAIASVLYAIGFGMLSLPPSFLLVIVSTVIWTWGEILSATNINVFVASKTPASHRGRVNSAVTVITNLGSLSAPVISGAIIHRGGAGSLWPIAFFMGLGAAALMVLLGAYERSRGPAASSMKTRI